MIELGAVQGTVPCTTPVGEPLFMYEKSSSWGGTRNRPLYHTLHNPSLSQTKGEYRRTCILEHSTTVPTQYVSRRTGADTA